MKERFSETEYSNPDATVEQVKAAIRAAKVIMQRPLPLTHVFPKIALVGYQEKASGRYMLLKEIRVFQTGELFASMTQMDGHVRLIALPHLTEEEFRSVQMDDLPNYRVYEKLTGLENQGKWENRDER